MLKINWKKKLIVMILIFTLTFADFALVSKTFATSILDSFSNDEGDTGSANVEFDASFVISKEMEEESDADKTVGASQEEPSTDMSQETVTENTVSEESSTENEVNVQDTTGNETNSAVEETVANDVPTENVTTDENEVTVETPEESSDLETEEAKEVVADVNTSTLSLKLNVKVSNDGYLKDGKIILGNGEELNFSINSENFENGMIQNFENSEIELVQMNAGSEANITFPIYYENTSYVELDNVSKSNVIKFEGTYVNDDVEIPVSKEINLSLSWQDNRETKVSSEVTKYVSYSINGANGVILQTLIKADNTTENKTLPVENSSIDVDVPTINGVKPESVKVDATSLMGTTGKGIDELQFGSDNWSYDSENNKLNINVQNSSELVSIQNEDEVLIDETAEEVEAYFAGSGTDEYLVTYIYKNVSLENVEITSNITSTFNMYGGTSLVSNEEKVVALTEEIGDIVTFSTETVTDSVSKGYTYLNYNNSDNKYEIEIDNNLIFNISYKDIVSGLYYEDSTNYYITKTGESVEQNDLYYKTLKVSQSNFNEMLGENGYINIYDNAGNLLATLNNQTSVTEEGNYEVSFTNVDIRWVRIETSAPITEGNLNIITVRAYKDTSFDKSTYKNFDRMSINSIARARYTDVNELVDAGTATSETKLEDTTTNAVLSIGQDSLSTLAMNNNVELKIELNNEEITSDVYGTSEFVIKMPEYIERVEITDSSIVYGEGLELSNIELFEQDGSIYLRVNVTGTQTALSSGIVSNGTNIVLNANIRVNLYAPAMTTNFELIYVNTESTSYTSERDGMGYNVAPITYSAPSGVVSVNTISGFNGSSETVSSVKQGTVIGDLDIYSTSKTAKMELIIMNNAENNISNISILGRTVFQGNTDLISGESLGTTTDAPMVSGIVSDSNNGTDFTIYYSTNANATNDLNDSANGWTTQVTDWGSVKSYLIVPNDSNYQLGVTQKLRFSYEFTIPENLPHNEDFYGTFGTYYTNNSNVATLNEVSIADLVGLSTGVGPELSVESSTNVTTINEFEEFEYTTVVKNTGEVTAENVVITVPIPEDISYSRTLTDNEDVQIVVDSEGTNVVYNLAEFEVGEEIEITTVLEIRELDRNNETNSVTIYSTVTAEDLGTTLTSEEHEINVIDAEMRITVDDSKIAEGAILKTENEIALNITAYNLTESDFTNAEFSIYIDESLDVTEMRAYNDDYSVSEIGEFDESTRMYTWSVDSIEAGKSKTFILYLKVGEITGTELSKDIELKVTGKADNVETYESKAFNITVGRASLIIKQTTNNTNTYVKEGEIIEYVFTITNEGPVMAKPLVLTDKVPEGITITEIKYEVNGRTVSRLMSETEEASVNISIGAGETKEVTVLGVARNLNGVQQLSVTNVGSISSGGETIDSNSVTHIIESTGGGTTAGESSSGTPSSSISSSSNILKTYNIDGIAWIDSNNNGARDDDEELVKDVTATLVDSDSGTIKQTAVTNSEGQYRFSGVENGNYIVIFDYDTVLYTVTTYQKENIASNINSDVISTKVEENGVYRNAAVTDVITIADGSISNIDIGLAEALKFDLSLDMGISRITVQNSQGTRSTDYNLETYTKTEISQRFLAGSEIYIEYTFTVRNEGEVAGYASSIVDYIPDGMNFNSSMNSDWYTGNDGNLYTTSLASTEIAPGESTTITLILSKTMTNENTGTVSNTAEIASDYNIYGISDMDSTPGNNNQSEDDFARADSILSVGTGGIWIYTSVIITTILLVGTAVFIVVLKRKNRLIKGGV